MDLQSPNYQHLLYFWVTAREGGIKRAGAALRLSPSTVSTQVRLLEDALGVELFARVGRGMSLTDAGQLVFRYADEIFRTGQELLAAVRGEEVQRTPRLEVGLADGVPKLIAYRMLAPALGGGAPSRLYCREDHPDALLGDLATHHLDVVILDRPVTPSEGVVVHNHLLGESAVGWFGVPDLAKRHGRRFPAGLDGAPCLLPPPGSHLRREVDAWFVRNSVHPRVVAEFDDSALMKVFGEAGHGVFPAPAVTRADIERQFGAVWLGPAEGAVERYYAVTAERQLRHPVVARLTEAARSVLFEKADRRGR